MTEADPILLPRWRFPWPGLLAPAIFLILTLLIFNDALFDTSKVIASKNTDLALLFLAIDMVMEGEFARGPLLGIFAMAMFLLAGHPQYVYYTGMAAAVYVLVNLFRAKNIPMALAGCALIVAGGVALAAVQLLTGMDFVSESVRSGGTKYEFSASFSFPPENLLTMISPGVFGPLAAPEGSSPPDAYFGRCYLWEVS